MEETKAKNKSEKRIKDLFYVSKLSGKIWDSKAKSFTAEDNTALMYQGKVKHKKWLQLFQPL